MSNLSFFSDMNRMQVLASQFQHKCDLCGRKYKHKGSLSLHQRYECGKEAQFHCPYCPYKGKQKISLKKHLMFKHAKNE